ncbi:Gfo/Idh/MocA family oxidoreductase [bacterium]|nr:Gfo/Idh/MocA family oxidoreductase [bacterium]
MTQFPIQNKKIQLAMLGMTEGNGHPYSWSIIINGRYNAEALAQCPYAAIIDYISKQPKNTLGIEDVEVSHVWTDNPEDAKLVAKVAEIENIVEDPKDVIGRVDAVLVATDIGSEHVERCKPFVEANVPIFVDKPLCDNFTDLKIFQQWINEGKPIISSSAMRYCKEYEPYHQSTYELGDLRYINVTMAKSWEKYGIHALETLYPIVGPGFTSIQNLGDKDRNIVHLHHSKGIDINIANVFDMIGGFGLVSLVGTKSGIQIKSNDTFYAFKKQLESYIHYLRTGVKPVPWEETKELMQLVAAGIKSREEGGIKINLSEVS